MGATAVAVLHAWAAAHRMITRLQARDGAHADLCLPGLTTRALPSLAVVGTLQDALRHKIRTRSAREEARRVRDWERWLETNWTTNWGAVYRWL